MKRGLASFDSGRLEQMRPEVRGMAGDYLSKAISGVAPVPLFR